MSRERATSRLYVSKRLDDQLRKERRVYVELDGKRIFEWRYGNFATAEEAAEMAGISLSTWLRAENGKGAVRLQTARRIARVLGTTSQALEKM